MTETTTEKNIEPSDLHSRFRPLYRGPRYPSFGYHPDRYYPNEIQNDYPHHFGDDGFHRSHEESPEKKETKVDYPFHFSEERLNHFNYNRHKFPSFYEDEDENSFGETTSDVNDITTTPKTVDVGDKQNDTLIESSDKKTDSDKDDSLDEKDVPKIRSRLLPDESCGLSVDERIIGGRDVQIGTYPWMARLGYTRK